MSSGNSPESHDAALTPRITAAQRRVLDYLLAQNLPPEEYVEIPWEVCGRDARPIETLEDLGLIECDIRWTKTVRATEPISFYRIARYV